ncbi:probable membrane-associated kinase regulator 4 [Lycium barbarum]|uniref:probable membrane-associated kinase regulator 4 n=1 Tax=Lycium barbarum TaxID=112863 RepID=UPI00293F2EB3|nr:probable membrane-associated kinase regulator 4 [Lycium barbarum]
MEHAQIYGHSIDDDAKEDYIELEVINSSNSTISLFHFKKISPSPPQQAKEFEFQMLPNFIDKNTAPIATADELFYNGKLLPLDHLPLHNNPIRNKFRHVRKSFDDFEQSFSTPFFQSGHIRRELNPQDYFFQYSSDDESLKRSKFLHVSKCFDQSFRTPCQFSRELNQEDYFFGYSTDDDGSKRSKWSKGSLTRKLRLIKQLSFDHSKLKCLINNSVDKLGAKKELFGKIHHSKSFSGAIKRLLTAKSCSSSSSVSRSKNTNGNIQDLHLLMRNKDVYGEVDPIQAAIGHCKNSQKQKFHSRKSSVSDTGLGRSLSASKRIFQEQERAKLCRG